MLVIVGRGGRGNRSSYRYKTIRSTLVKRDHAAMFFLFRFYVVNPTNVGYDFSWESQGNANPAWRCVTQRGMILAGKRGEMVFEYTPDDTETAEVGELTTVFVYSSLYTKYRLEINIYMYLYLVYTRRQL